MTGTEGTVYTEVLSTKLGKLGFRALSGGGFRVRLEPASPHVTSPAYKQASWKKPNSDGNRFSLVVGSAAELASAIASASSAISSL